MKKTLILVGLALTGWCLLGLEPLMQIARTKQANTLRLNLHANTSSMIQVFFDTGPGFREEDSVCKPVSPVDGFADYDFPVPTARIPAIRLDPLTCAGEVILHSAVVVNARGQVQQTLPLDRFVASNQIRSLRQTPEGLQVTTEDPAPDPNLILTLATPWQPHDRRPPTVAWAKVIAWHTAALLLLVATAWALAGPARQRWGQNWLDFSLPPGKEPEQIPVELYLYAAGVLAAVVSCALSLEQTLYKLLA